MRRFLVVKDDDREVDFFYRRRGLDDLGDGTAYIHTQNATEWNGNFDADTKVHTVNTLVEAEHLAQHLSAKFAPNQYMIAEVSLVYKAEVGPVKVAKFSDKGLMPV